MRYYKAILEKNLTHKQALKLAKKLKKAITRPSEWEGIHCEDKNGYKILLKSGEVIINPEVIMNTKRTDKDWAVVEPTKRALKKIER